MPRTSQEQLVHFLSDMYSVEQQALVQMASAPKRARDDRLAADFLAHHAETERQAELVAERLEAHGGSPSRIKDAVMRLGGRGFLLFARVQPETPGKLVAHAYAYEAMEWAGYQMLFGLAEHAGDAPTADVALAIARQEQAMMHRLERSFDGAERASHADEDPEELPRHVRRHLGDAHALESQGVELLERSRNIAGDAALERIYREHLGETHHHARLLEQRLDELDDKPSPVKDTALSIGGYAWGLFFQAQSDTPTKLAAFAYAVEHLEIAGYELLRRTARRAGDPATESLCEQILAQERAMADRLAGAFDAAVRSTLEAVSA